MWLNIKEKKQIKSIQDNKKQLANKKQPGNNELLLKKKEKYLRIFTKKDSIK